MKVVSSRGLSLRRGVIECHALAQAVNQVNHRLWAAACLGSTGAIDLYQIIDLRMLSGLMGEMVQAELCKSEKRIIKNPNIDGYPDLCDISLDEDSEFAKGADLSAFLNFRGGGLEVKNTFGVKKQGTAVAPRDQRIGKIARRLVWKAHHRQTDRLIALHSDYAERIPQIIAGYYSDCLEPGDWTAKQNPREGSTMTSFCQTTHSAFEKLRNGLMFYAQEVEYDKYLNG
jgi:hypothetical protein